jgi:hypothetical protein
MCNGYPVVGEPAYTEDLVRYRPMKNGSRCELVQDTILDRTSASSKQTTGSQKCLLGFDGDPRPPAGWDT